jgi:hypothetical protein
VRALLLAPLLLLPILLGGCAEQDVESAEAPDGTPRASASARLPSGSATAAAPSTTATAVVEEAAPGSSAAPSASRATTGTLRTCSGPSLDIALQSQDSGAGSTDYVVAFSNRGPTPCRVSGAPGAYLIGADGDPLGREADGVGAEGPFVRVPSGGSATTVVRVVNVRDGGGPLAGRCTPKPATAIAIDAPNYRRYEQLPVTAWGCAETDVSSLSVGVLRSGTR